MLAVAASPQHQLVCHQPADYICRPVPIDSGWVLVIVGITNHQEDHRDKIDTQTESSIRRHRRDAVRPRALAIGRHCHHRPSVDAATVWTVYSTERKMLKLTKQSREPRRCSQHN